MDDQSEWTSQRNPSVVEGGEEECERFSIKVKG